MKRIFNNAEIRMREDAGQKIYTFVASDFSRDSHRTKLDPSKWDLERFSGNGPIGYMHNIYGGDLCNAPDPDDVIGKGRAYIEGDKLMIDIIFEPEEINEKAAKIQKKVEFGSLKAVSVGFNPIGEGRYGEGEEARGASNETFYFDGQELLEVSIVNIPSNKNALKKSLRDNTSNALLWLRNQLNGRSFADIEAMTIRQVLDAIDGVEEVREVEEVEETKEVEERELTIEQKALIAEMNIAAIDY